MEDNSYVGHYGIVKIIGGKHKGRFGYYDDDDVDENGVPESVIYFGEMMYNSNYFYIKQKYITQKFTIEDLKKRQDEIRKQLWTQISTGKRLELIEEMELINSEIFRKYEDYLDNNKLKNKKVFLSHSSLDKSLVISVALDLKSKGIDTWLDASDILPGESIVKKIEEGLNQCDFILLFLSKNSVQSNWVTKEWETILWDEVNTNKVKIIPIKLDNCSIPKILQTKKYIDMSLDYNAGLYQIIDTIKQYEKEKV